MGLVVNHELPNGACINRNYLRTIGWVFVSYLKLTNRSMITDQQGLLLVPFARTSAKQSRAFSVVGPSIWNGLPSQIRTLPRALSPAFSSQLKTALSSRVGVGSASE